MSAFRKAYLRLALLIGGLLLACVPLHAQVTFTTLHSFTRTEGGGPSDSFIIGSDGNFYGTTAGGGAHGTGAIIKVTLSGAVTTIYSFSALDSNFHNSDGYSPDAGLIQGTDGNFYGNTYFGGMNGNGTLFKVTPGGALTVLHTFSAFGSNNTNADGASPQGLLAQGSDGNIYGLATQGGANAVGTFYQVTPSGKFTMLHSFLASEGVFPEGLILGSDGFFYGVANGGALPVVGTVFKITSAGAVTVLHSFTGRPSDGSMPYAVLTEGTDGNFYGTTQQGGTNGTGTVFKMTPTGTVTILHSFAAFSNGTQSNADGADPYAPLLPASDGNFYGTTYFGGTNGTGTIFKITPGGTFTLLYVFTAQNTSNFTNADGAHPSGGLIEGSDYNLYGMASGGGQNDYGTVYKLNVNLTPPPVITSLRPGSVNASGPAFSLLVKGTGFLNTSAVNWTAGTTTTPLTTTYVSGTQLKAAVPASLTANPGRAKLTVTTPGTNPSNAKTFTIKLTTMKLVAATLTRDSSTGVITANITLKNIGYLTAPNLSLTKSTLGPQTSPVATTTTLPVSLGSVAAGASVSTSLSYPGSAGTSGTVAYLKVSGKFTGGAMGTALKVTLP